MAEIIKVYKEHLPALRFIGKRYTENDRINGGFGHKWCEWFQNGWFSPLEKSGNAENIENGYIGFMHCNPSFDYWIGAFLPPDTIVPDGYDFFDVPEGDVGICWIKGTEDGGSIYAMHEKCLESVKENGMSIRKAEDSKAYFFERYNCPRFTEKDQNGNVILDYGIYLTD